VPQGAQGPDYAAIFTPALRAVGNSDDRDGRRDTDCAKFLGQDGIVSKQKALVWQIGVGKVLPND
jgi:hypothetical protein